MAMKNLVLLTITILLFSFDANSKSKSDKMYDNLSDKEGVTHFLIKKNMSDAFNINFGDDENKNVSGDLNSIRFISYNPEKGEYSGNEFIREAIGYLPKSSFKKFENDNENDNAEIWLLGNKRKYKECHIFIKNENPEQRQFIVSFYGDFLVEDIDELKEVGENISLD